eukprot:XP_001698220.1 predicted protein [Chlamydomonas reinhardtii]
MSFDPTGDPNCFSLFVGDLPPEVHDHFLESFFRQYFPSVRSAKVMMDNITGRSKGFGFVRFAVEGERDRALNEMNGVFISSRQHTLSASAVSALAPCASNTHCRNTPTQLPGELDPQNTTLFVGGLSAHVSEDALRGVFGRYGEISYVKIPPGKGCGFVHFADRQAAEYAMQEVNGTIIGGSANYYNSNGQGQGQGGSGGGSGGQGSSSVWDPVKGVNVEKMNAATWLWALHNMAPPKIKDVHLKLQTGHGPGQSSVAYANTPNEVSLVTSGADGRVYLRDALILEPQCSCKVDTPPATILAVDPKGKYVAVGDDSYVKLYKLPSLTLERSACRFNLTLRALSFSPDGTKLAAAGDDNLIKLVEVKDGSVYRSLNCDDYVLALAWDPDGAYLAATLRTGGLVVYDTGSGRLEKRVDAQCERVDYSSPRRHAPSWHPDGGSVLAVPVGAEGDVALHERLSWEATGYLSGEHRKAVNIVAFSPNGVYAATAGQDKRIVVWDVNSVTAVAAATAEEVMSGLVWRPDGNELAMVGESGGVGVWSGVVPTEMPGPAVSAAELERLQREQERLADLRKRGEKAEREAAGADLVPPEGGEIREEVIEEMQVEVEEGADGAGGSAGAKAAGAEAAARCVSSRPVDDHHVIEVLFHDSSRFSSRVPLLTDYYGFDRAALGSTFVAVATSRQLLRLFTLGGAQQAVLRLEGQPVALVAAGGQLAVAWHSGPPNPHTKSQALSLSLYDTLSLVCVFSQPLPLTPGTTLTWLGFAEDTGVPAAADSAGVVCVRLEAAEMSGQVEEASDLRHLKNQGEAKHDAALLKAFQKFVRAERHGRALEVAAMLNMCKSLSGAVAVANHHQARGLAERIAVVLEQKQAIIAANEAMAAGADPYGHHHHQHQQAAAEAAEQQQVAPAGRSYTPIPFARRAGGLSTGPKSGRGLPTPNTLLLAATAKPDPGSDSHKRKQQPSAAFNNPFARKAAKLGKGSEAQKLVQACCIGSGRAYQELIEESEGNAASVHANILNQDLKRIGKPCLPDDINRAANATVKGPHVLQVSSVVDTSRPTTKETGGGGGDGRMLCLRLTDGKITCKAVEHVRCDGLNEELLAPGTKVLLSNASVRAGVVMLQPKTIKHKLMQQLEAREEQGTGPKAQSQLEADEALARELQAPQQQPQRQQGRQQQPPEPSEGRGGGRDRGGQAEAAGTIHLPRRRLQRRSHRLR